MFMIGCGVSASTAGQDVVVPTPAALGSYNEHADSIGVRVLIITYAGAKNAPSQVKRTEAQARERAKMVANIAQMSGEHFAELALKYGDRTLLPEGDAKGDVLLERGSKLLDPKVTAAAFALAIEEVSGPVQTEEGFVIVKRTVTPIGGPAQISARHILIAFRGAKRAAESITRTREQALELAKKVAADARSGKDWDELWEENSNEPAGQRGGDLGTFGRGQMVPSFEQAAFRLQVGAISDPIETPYGFHVIERTK